MSDITVKFFSTLPKSPFDLNIFYPGPPQSTEEIFSMNFVRNVGYASNFASSLAILEGTLSNTYILTINKNNNAVGTISFYANSSVSFSNTASVQFLKGDQLSLIAQSIVETGITNIQITLAGVRS